MKKLLALVLAIVCVWSLSACGAPAADNGGSEPAAPASGNLIVETRMQNGEPVSTARPATPIPDSDLWFENVWRAYRQRNQLMT